MLGFNHALIGTFSYLGLARLFTSADLATIGLPASLAALASLLPDIDTPYSGLGRRMLPVSIFISSKAGHRGFTHSFKACLLVLAICGILSFLRPVWTLGCFAFLVGYSSHIFADWLTTEGIAFFWPNPKRYRSPVDFRTGSLVEYAIGFVFSIILAVFIYKNILQNF